MSAYASYDVISLGEYSVGDTITVQFTGKNIPNLGLFTNQKDIQPVGAGGTGLFLQASSNTTGAGSYAYSLVGPWLQDPGKTLYESWNTGRTYESGLGKNYELACDNSYANSGYEGSYFGLFNLQNGVTYRYTVSTASTGTDDSVIVNATLVKWNGYEWVSLKTLSWNVQHGLASLAGRYAIIYGLSSKTGIDEIEFYYYHEHTDSVGADKEYLLYAYPGSLEMVTEANRTTYREAGMNALLLGDSPSYSLYDVSATGNNAELYTILSDSSQKVIMMDNFLHNLSIQTGNLTDGVAREIYNNGDHVETVTFASQEDVNKYVADRMAKYKDLPAFYGLRLKDEPSYTQFTALGQVYKAIKACMPECFVLVNLLPYYGEESAFTASYETLSTEESYRAYLNAWIDASEADYLMADSYPIRTDTTEQTAHAKGLQIMAEVCEARSLQFHLVTQAYTTATYREITAADMLWQTNLAMAFGADCISYYRYTPKDSELGGLVTETGEKTALYEAVREINASMQAIAPELLDYKYVGLNVYGNTTSSHISSLTTSEFTHITGATVTNNKVSLLITEMTDGNGRTGYMIVNAVSTATIGANSADLSKLDATVVLTFADGVEGYKKAVNDTLVSCNNTSFTLGAGEAVFIIVE